MDTLFSFSKKHYKNNQISQKYIEGSCSTHRRKLRALNVVEKPDAIIKVRIILDGCHRNTVWVLDGIRVTEDVDQ